MVVFKVRFGESDDNEKSDLTTSRNIAAYHERGLWCNCTCRRFSGK